MEHNNIVDYMLIFVSEQDGGAAAEWSYKVSCFFLPVLTAFH